jgi:hypothetical protein
MAISVMKIHELNVKGQSDESQKTGHTSAQDSGDILCT